MSGAFRWFLLISVVVILFFWKILFTGQYSMILGWEGTNQPYAWYSYSARTVQQGILPAWDPYTESGRNFVGETQTGVFYPLKLLLYLAPFDAKGFLSERIFHQMYVLAHLLAGFFMFLCAREIGVRNRFAAFVAALCFTLGGFLGRMGWVHLMDSAIWLPLIFLFLLRALRALESSRRLLYSCCAGLALAMSILAGSIHIPLMDVVVIVSAAGLAAYRPEDTSAVPTSLRSRLLAGAMVVFVVGIVSFAAAAVQLLPSIEFSPLARRWVWEWSGLFHERVPYLVPATYAHLGPRAIFAFLFGAATNGGSEISPYIGIMPLLLTVIGIWKNWSNRWVKYLTALGVVAFIYGLGGFSLLNGLAYLLVPFLDKAYEAGRFLYLTHFAMALLAGFGVQSLFAENFVDDPFYILLKRILGWVVLVLSLAVGIPAFLGKPEIGKWPYVTFFLLLATWTLFLYIIRGNRHVLARFLLTALIVCDFYAFTWIFANRLQEQRANSDHLYEMKSLEPVADFLKAQAAKARISGGFRTHFDKDFLPSSMGDVYGVQTTIGYGATMINDYFSALWSPNRECLFNVRYYLGLGAGRTETPVFESGKWKVYENPAPCPRAWVVNRIVVEPPETVRKRIEQESLDLQRVAYLSEPLRIPVADTQQAPAEIRYLNYQPDQFSLDAELSAAGLLVFSEVYHPGWGATVNGRPAHIYKVDNILRGLVVSPGSNHIVMQYRPMSIRVGASLSALAFLGTLLFAAVVLWRRHPESEPRP